jgi:hypothetical protein
MSLAGPLGVPRGDFFGLCSPPGQRTIRIGGRSFLP